MKEASNFEGRNDSDRFVHDLAELNKNIKLKPNKLEKLKYLESVRTAHQIYVDHCKREIEMIERIHEYEKEFPSGPLYPLPPDPSPSKNAVAKPLPAPAMPDKIIQPFPKYLKHQKSDEFAAKLKEEFNTGRGKHIRLLIEVLKTYDPPLLNIVKGDMKNIISSLKNYFDRDIGSYSAINEYLIKSKDSNDLMTIKKRIDFILTQL